MLQEVKRSLASIIGKQFKVDPSNQDITNVKEVIELKSLIEISDLISELIAPKLLYAL
jgi:hypothetical protein